jgi:hypothetical protein
VTLAKAPGYTKDAVFTTEATNTLRRLESWFCKLTKTATNTLDLSIIENWAIPGKSSRSRHSNTSVVECEQHDSSWFLQALSPSLPSSFYFTISLPEIIAITHTFVLAHPPIPPPEDITNFFFSRRAFLTCSGQCALRRKCTDFLSAYGRHHPLNGVGYVLITSSWRESGITMTIHQNNSSRLQQTTERKIGYTSTTIKKLSVPIPLQSFGQETTRIMPCRRSRHEPDKDSRVLFCSALTADASSPSHFCGYTRISNAELTISYLLCEPIEEQ